MRWSDRCRAGKSTEFTARLRHERNLSYACYSDHLNRCLLIFNDRILDSRVVDGMPSFLAAPEGPDTRPRVSASTASIISFSWSGGTLESVPVAGLSVPRLCGQPTLVDPENVALRNNDRPFNDVL